MPATLKSSTIHAIEKLLGGLEKTNIFSMTAAVKAVRSLAPTCELTDGELAEVIAAHAVERAFKASRSTDRLIGTGWKFPSSADRFVDSYIPLFEGCRITQPHAGPGNPVVR